MGASRRKPDAHAFSYDYLGLIGDERINNAAIAAIQKYGTGTGGVRLLTGTIDLHHQVEREIAAYKELRPPSLSAPAISPTSRYCPLCYHPRIAFCSTHCRIAAWSTPAASPV